MKKNFKITADQKDLAKKAIDKFENETLKEIAQKLKGGSAFGDVGLFARWSRA